MGILIVAGVAVLLTTLAHRMSSVSPPNASVASIVLDEPAGTRIGSASIGVDRIALQLGGGGPDRVVVVDTKSGRVVARVALSQ